MKLCYTPAAAESFTSAPDSVQRTFLKQAALLQADLRHPSLRAKKYDETRDIWQARVNRSWRFYFTIQGDVYVVLDILRHPK